MERMEHRTAIDTNKAWLGTCFFKWAKISILNILYILYKFVGDKNFGSIIYF